MTPSRLNPQSPPPPPKGSKNLSIKTVLSGELNGGPIYVRRRFQYHIYCVLRFSILNQIWSNLYLYNANYRSEKFWNKFSCTKVLIYKQDGFYWSCKRILRVNLMKIRVYWVLSAMSKVTLISITNIEKPGRNLVQYTKTGHTIDMILRPSADPDRTLI